MVNLQPTEGDDDDVPQDQEVLQIHIDAAERHRHTLDRAGIGNFLEGVNDGLEYLKVELYRHYSDVHLARLARVNNLKLMISANKGMECIEKFLKFKMDLVSNEIASTSATPDVSAEQS